MTGWAQQTIDLSAYKGQTVYLGFLGISAYGNNMTLEVDALGNTNRFTYDSDGNVLTSADPLGQTTMNTYRRIPPRGSAAHSSNCPRRSAHPG